jgi:nucleotide-binding universal stress UspA family protein
MKILLGYDGSAYADAAVDDLRRAGLPADVEAVVMTAVNVTPHLPPSCYKEADPATEAAEPPIIRQARTLARAAMRDAEATARQGADRVSDQFPAWKVRPETTPDYAAYRALVLKADRWRPDLLVVGSQGRSAAGPVLLGSVSTKVLSHARCSVRVARSRPDAARAAGDPPRLVLGIDGSADSAAAASAVADRAWPPGTAVRVVMALDRRLKMALAFGLPLPVWAPGVKQEWDDTARARHVAEAVTKELGAAGLMASATVTGGNPKQVLLREAEQFGADCVFLGAQGHSTLDRFLLGSVSTAVATRAPCSVEVVRQG